MSRQKGQKCKNRSMLIVSVEFELMNIKTDVTVIMLNLYCAVYEPLYLCYKHSNIRFHRLNIIQHEYNLILHYFN